MQSAMDPGIEAQIREWRSYLLRRRTIHHVDVDELEDHLRSEISELGAAGLSGDESFLVAIKRLGGANELSREFARERSSQLWKQLVLAGDTARERSGWAYAELLVAVCFAIGAAVAFKLPAVFGIDPFGAGASDSANGDAEAVVLPAQHRAVDTAFPHWLSRMEAEPSRPRRRMAGRTLRCRRDPGQRIPVRAGQCHRGAVGEWQRYGGACGDSPPDHPVARGGCGVPGRRLAGRRAADGLRAVHGGVVHLLHADRIRRRCPHRPDRGAVRGDRNRRGARHHLVGAAVRRDGCGRRGGLAGRGETERDREHGAGADQRLHPVVRPDARGGHHRHGADRQHHRGRTRCAHPPRCAPGGRRSGWCSTRSPPAIRMRAQRSWTRSNSSSWSAPS